MDIVDRTELLDGMCDTNEEKDKLGIRRCYLLVLQNPFENSTIVGSERGSDSAK